MRKHISKTQSEGGITPGVSLYTCALTHSPHTETNTCLLVNVTQEQEAEAGKSSQVQGQAELQNEFQPALAV